MTSFWIGKNVSLLYVVDLKSIPSRALYKCVPAGKKEISNWLTGCGVLSPSAGFGVKSWMSACAWPWEWISFQMATRSDIHIHDIDNTLAQYMSLSWIMLMPWGLVLKQNLSPKAAPAIQPLRGAMNPIDNFLATAGNWGTVGEKLPDCTDVIVAPWQSLVWTARSGLNWKH